MVRPMGLTAALSGAMREHAVKVLDLLLAEVQARFKGDAEALERDLVDEVRRWAERREESMFPSGRPEPPYHPTIEDHRRWFQEQYGAPPEDDGGEPEEDQPLVHEPTNGHGKPVPEE